jgi:hypothetical protein
MKLLQAMEKRCAIVGAKAAAVNPALKNQVPASPDNMA